MKVNVLPAGNEAKLQLGRRKESQCLEHYRALAVTG